jgi:hypothetical protein
MQPQFSWKAIKSFPVSLVENQKTKGFFAAQHPFLFAKMAENLFLLKQLSKAERIVGLIN